jgi:NitT/TauT family transport system substrate-binding protein
MKLMWYTILQSKKSFKAILRKDAGIAAGSAIARVSALKGNVTPMTPLHAFRLCTASTLLALALGLFATAAAKAEAVTVSQWGALYYGAPYAVALAKGYFKEGKVDVTEVVGGDGGGTTVRNTLAAKLPFGEVSLAAAIEAIRAGLPIRIVNTGVDSLGDFVLITRPENPLSSVKDLKGKKIGFTRPGSVSQMVVLLMLQQVGLTAKEVEMVSVGGVGAALTTIKNGTIDAAFTGEPLWTQEKNNLKKIVWLHEIMDTRFTQIVGIVETSYAAKNPDAVRNILAARRKAVAFIYQNPDEAADIVAAAYNQSAPMVRSVFTTLVGLKYWSEGKLDLKSMDKMVEGLRLIEAIKGDIDLKGMLDTSYLPADLR